MDIYLASSPGGPGDAFSLVSGSTEHAVATARGFACDRCGSDAGGKRIECLSGWRGGFGDACLGPLRLPLSLHMLARWS